MKMIEVSVGQQHEVNWRQVFKPEPGTFDSFEQEEPVGEVGINENVEVGELDEERRVPNPRDGHLAKGQFGKSRTLGLAGAARQQRPPDHLPKELAGLEMPRRGKILERSRERLTARRGTIRGVFRHKAVSILLILRFE